MLNTFKLTAFVIPQGYSMRAYHPLSLTFCTSELRLVTLKTFLFVSLNKIKKKQISIYCFKFKTLLFFLQVEISYITTLKIT